MAARTGDDHTKGAPVSAGAALKDTIDPHRERSLRLMVVEDEPVVALQVTQTVLGLGHMVCAVARTATEAVAMAPAARPDLALMDIRLADDSDGIEVARRLNAGFGIRSIFLSGYTDHATMSRITSSYPLGVVHKPFSVAQLRTALDLAARRLRLRSRG